MDKFSCPRRYTKKQILDFNTLGQIRIEVAMWGRCGYVSQIDELMSRVLEGHITLRESIDLAMRIRDGIPVCE